MGNGRQSESYTTLRVMLTQHYDWARDILLCVCTNYKLYDYRIRLQNKINIPLIPNWELWFPVDYALNLITMSLCFRSSMETFYRRRSNFDKPSSKFLTEKESRSAWRALIDKWPIKLQNLMHHIEGIHYSPVQQLCRESLFGRTYDKVLRDKTVIYFCNQIISFIIKSKTWTEWIWNVLTLTVMFSSAPNHPGWLSLHFHGVKSKSVQSEMERNPDWA